MSLLWHGAEVDATDSNGQTALHRAVIVGDISIVQSLIVFDADPNLKDNKLCTPRHICCTNMSDSTNSDLILYILHVVNAKRCQRNVDNQCKDGCALNGRWFGYHY